MSSPASCPNTNDTSSPAAMIFGLVLSNLISKQCQLGQVQYPVDRFNDVVNGFARIDYIVVGAGSTGSVIVNRLSENPNMNVLLIEAGGDPTPSSYVPGLAFNIQKSSIDWAYTSEKQAGVCEGLKNGVCNVPRGKGLGGSSLLNAMMYIIGNQKDYDGWNNDEWSFKNVEKYFHKSFDDYYYAGFADEPMYFNKTQVTNALVEAVQEMGMSNLSYTNRNINPNIPGTLHLKTNIKNGERFSTAQAFLAPIKDRSNLYVLKNTLATQIIFEGNKAVGVQISRDGKLFTIKFNKALVLSAGAVNTPKLLFQSGVGPRDELQKENIEVKFHLPAVGKSLYDHPIFPIPVQINPLRNAEPKPENNTTGPNSKTDGAAELNERSADDFYNYITRRKGGLSGINIGDQILFLDTTGASPTNPDIEMIPFYYPQFDTSFKVMLGAFNWNDSMGEDIVSISKQKDIFFLIPLLLKPISFGHIEFAKDVNANPKIFFNWFQEEHDLNTLVRAIRFFQKFINTNSFKKFEAKFIRVRDDVCESTTTYDSDDYWKCLIKRLASSCYHLSSTCRMGEDVEHSVVDYKLKVHQLDNVMIADASVMPYTVNSNIHATCVMIGEKAADIVKQNWS